MAKFSELANVPAQDVQPPKPIPVGHYLFLIDGMPEFEEAVSQRTNEPYERYTVKCRPVQATDDVDQSTLRDVLEGGSLQERAINLQIFQPHVMKQLLEACGLIKPNNKKSLGQLIGEMPGAQFLGYVTHTPGQRDKTMLYANIDSFTAAK